MAPGPKRRSIADKLKVIERLEAGCPVRAVALEFGLGLTTVKDLKKNKEKLKSFSQKFEPGSEAVKIRKTMKMPESEAIDEAVYKWYVQHHSSGIPVRGVEILAAAERFAKQMNLQKSTFSSGWLWRFRNRHGLPAFRGSVEAHNASDVAEVESFRQMLNEIIEQSSLSLSQLYNFDETGLLYRMLPEDTLISRHYDAVKEQKLSKERLSALLCANASGSHRLKAVIVGKARQPCATKEPFNRLPVHYYHSPTAWFTRDIVQDWFFKYAEPEIRRFQIEDLKIPPDDVCAVILMDQAPAHPDSHSLSSHDGRIKCLTIPPNVSMTQPMEQGIILSAKRLYRRKFLDEVLILPEEAVDEGYGICEVRSLANIKNYSLKAAIHNFADAWQDITQATLSNSWKRLMDNSDVQWEMEGIEATDFLKALTTAGETEVTEGSVLAWLEEDEADPGYQMLTEEEIIQEVLQPCGEGAPEDESYDVMEVRKKIKLSTIRNHCDSILAYIESSEDPGLEEYYQHFRDFRKTIIQRQQRNASRKKDHNFFSSRIVTPPMILGPETEDMLVDVVDCTKF